MVNQNNGLDISETIRAHLSEMAAFWAIRAAADFAAMDRARDAGRHIAAIMYQKTGEIAARAARHARGLDE